MIFTRPSETDFYREDTFSRSAPNNIFRSAIKTNRDFQCNFLKNYEMFKGKKKNRLFGKLFLRSSKSQILMFIVSAVQKTQFVEFLTYFSVFC